MSQIQKKFIANNAVDGTKIQLLNAQSMTALNSSASPVNLLQLNGSNNLLIQQTVDMDTLKVTNMADPTNPQDAVTKAYADALIAGLSWKEVVVSATTAGLPTYTYSSGVITETGFGALPAQDGVTLTAGQRLLVKNETSINEPYNGIYVVTNVGTVSTSFVLTRSSDANTAAELQSSAVSVGEAASTQAGFVYFENQPITTVGTDNVNFIQINSGMTYTFGNGLNLSGSTVTVLAANTSILVASGGVSVNLSAASGLTVSSGLEVQAFDGSISVASGGISVHKDAAGALTVSGSGLAVAVDGTTVKIATDALHASTNQVDNLTLNSTDITNQYKDLTYPINVTASVFLNVLGGIIQKNGTDYTVSATGGVAGVGRISFAGDLATGGNAALVSGDVLVVAYEHF